MDTPAAPLPAIPAKRYFTIGEVAELCGVKPYVLRYWEQEFTQLRPMKRRGNRRYYQHHEVLLIRRIRDLLYDQGFTISGARNRLADAGLHAAAAQAGELDLPDFDDPDAPAGATLAALPGEAGQLPGALQGPAGSAAAGASAAAIGSAGASASAAAAHRAVSARHTLALDATELAPLPEHPSPEQVRQELLAIRDLLGA